MSAAVQGRVVVVQQPDGWWRWRFEPQADGEPLVSGEAYPDEQEALASAGQAYPELRTDVDEEPEHTHCGPGVLLRRYATAAAVLVIVVLAARAANRRAG